MSTVSLKNAENHLAELLQGMKAGEELVIVEDGRTVARVISVSPLEPVSPKPRKLGFLAGSVVSMSEDFDAPLPDMQEYMS